MKLLLDMNNSRESPIEMTRTMRVPTRAVEKVCLSLIILFLMGCGDSARERMEPEDGEEPYRLSLIVPLIDHPYWKQVIQGVYDTADKYSFDAYVTGPNEINPQEQVDHIETAVVARVDGIITQAVVPSLVDRALQHAALAGIPTVLVDSDSPESTRDYYVGTDNWAAGKAAGEAMAEATSASATIGILTGVEFQHNLQERIDGFRTVVSEYPQMRVAKLEVTNIDILQATRIAREMLVEHPDIDAIFGVSANDIVGAAKAISERSDFFRYNLVGFDAMQLTLDAISLGFVQATIVQEPYEMGVQAVELLHQIESGTAPDTKKIHTDFRVMTAETIENAQPLGSIRDDN